MRDAPTLHEVELSAVGRSVSVRSSAATLDEVVARAQQLWRDNLAREPATLPDPQLGINLGFQGDNRSLYYDTGTAATPAEERAR